MVGRKGNYYSHEPPQKRIPYETSVPGHTAQDGIDKCIPRVCTYNVPEGGEWRGKRRLANVAYWFAGGGGA